MMKPARHIPAAIGLMALSLVSACSGASAPDPSLNCAALISAADHLMAQGEAATDKDFRIRAPGLSMVYFAKYGVENKIGQTEAFANMKARRETLIGSTSAKTIVKRARRCMDNSPIQ